MSDLVRVRLENGHEKTVPASLAKKAGLEVLDEPTHNADGTLRKPTRKGGRPRKKKTTVAEAASAKQAAAPAPTAEEATE